MTSPRFTASAVAVAVAVAVAFVAAVVLPSVPVAATGDAPLRQQFEAFKAQFDRVYPSMDAELAAFATFTANHAWVMAQNAASSSPNAPFGQGVQFKLNQFADLTAEQWHQQVLMPQDAAPMDDVNNRRVEAAKQPSALPTAFDWRASGAVTGVKNQGSVGTCWAFSTTGNIEGQYFLSKAGPLTSFSEEFLVDCDSNNCGVFGGWPYRAYEYIMKRGGLPTEKSYPYCCGTGTCYPCMADHNMTFCGQGPEYCNATQNAHCKVADLVAKVASWQPVSKNETEIAAKLVATGPLSTLMDASFLQFYKSGIWNPKPGLFGCDSSGQSLDHAILFVGYGEAGSTPYWTIKNSWGATWGEEGYFRIIRGEHKCGINAAVTTATVSA